MPARRLIPPVVAALALLAGCGGGGGDPKPAQTATTTATTPQAAAPATGDRIVGTGYELRAAKGWTDVKAQLQARADVVLATQSGSIVNVLREKIPSDANRSVVLAALSRSVLAGADAARTSRSTKVVLDGADGVAFGVRLKTDQGSAAGRVVIVVHGGYAYAIAGSSSPDEPVPTDTAFASMLASWRWT